MSTFAPPIRRGDFFYSSVLYADPGNSNSHPRASVAELAGLLRPEAPNLYSKGVQSETSLPAKDPPWHFYSAQLIHYGLPVTKDKNTAKVRLLNAMNQFKLEVPTWVLQLEGELKREWEAENRKMSRSAKVAMKTEESSVRGKGKTKLIQGGNSGVNVTVNLSLSPGLSILDGLRAQQTITSTPTKSPSSKRKRADKGTSLLPSTPKKVGKVEKEPTNKRVKKEPIPKQKTPRVKYEQSQSSSSGIPRSLLKQEHSSPPRQRRQYTSPPQIRPEAYVDTSNSILLSGLYEIDCLTASEIFSDYDLTLTLARDSPHDCWWATFRWGAWDGIIQMSPEPALDEPASLGWRLRDLETGQLKFGKKCTGQMTCFSDQTLRAELYEVPGIGTVEFEGRRLAGGAVNDDLSEEWNAFISEAYGR